MTKLNAGLTTSLPASDPGSAAAWGSKRIKPRPQSCLCLTWSGYPSNDDPQLAVFVRYVSSDVVVKEELLDLIALKETTRGVDIKKVLDETLMRAKIPLNKFVSVATDGAPAMVERNAGLIALIKNDCSYPDFLPIHCIIHRENLISRYFKYEDIMKTVLEIVNFICKHSKLIDNLEILLKNWSSKINPVMSCSTA